MSGFGLFTAIGTLHFAPSDNTIQSSGFRTAGVGAANYVRLSSADLAAYVARDSSLWKGMIWDTDADGNGWLLNEPCPNTDMVGANANGYRAYAGNVTTGTDDSDIIQGLIDWSRDVAGLPVVYIAPKRYRISKTIRTGNRTFSQISIQSLSNPSYSPSSGSGFPGATFISDNDRYPLISVNGARKISISGIHLLGVNQKWCIDNNLGYNNGVAVLGVDDTYSENWGDISLSPLLDCRYAPYQAIAIDEYCGVKPSASSWVANSSYVYGDCVTNAGNLYKCITDGISASSGGPTTSGGAISDNSVVWKYCGVSTTSIALPDLTYPAYMGAGTSYGQLPSFDVLIDDCIIDGFAVAVGIKICNADGNADYIKLRRVDAYRCKYRISGGGSQMRALSDTDGGGFGHFSQYDGLTHGLRTGRFEGVVSNYCGGLTINVVNLAPGYSSPFTIGGGSYWEGAWRIGNLVGAGGAVKFDNVHFNFAMPVAGNTRGDPPNVLSGTSTRHLGVNECTAPLRISGKLIFSSVISVLATDVIFDCYVQANERMSGSIPKASCYASNALAGGVYFSAFGCRPGSVPVLLSASFRLLNGLTGTVVGPTSMTGGGCGSAIRAYGSPIYAHRLFPGNASVGIDISRNYQTFLCTGIASPVLSGRVLTGTWTGLAGSADRLNLLPGDIWTHENTSTVFFVSSFDTATGNFVAKMQNNWKGAPGSETPVIPLDFSTGKILTMTSRVYTPSTPVFFTATGSVSSVGDITTATPRKITNATNASKIRSGDKIAGAGIPADTFVMGISGTDVFISNDVTATSTGVALTVGTSSAILSNVGDMSEAVGNFAIDIVAGDAPVVDTQQTGIIGGNGVTISAVNATARTITLSTAALRSSSQVEPRARLLALRVAPPANVTNP